MAKLTHIDREGKARMVDVGSKGISVRVARASGHITMRPGTIDQVKENSMKKGDVLAVAQISGITAAKQTSLLIPLCHNIALDSIHVEAVTDDTGVAVHSEVRCTGRTGVEMEALTAVSVALLAVYDMCKAVDKDMIIDYIKLTHKEKHEDS
ncbi:MAG: cyclic pyranopterin monophosphate synthase MoaC [Bacteroidetes bacterium]|nr:cyclic pyranopterin monophosphate synthase MoaC [Bacteroidota bacterium]